MADTEHSFGGLLVIACFHLPQFGIAVERLRQPGLWGEPVVLVNDERKVVAASDEAAAYGVSLGNTETGARSLCPSLQVFHYDTPAYREQAEDLWNIYAVESSIVEPISPELCYVLLTPKTAIERARYLALKLSGAVRCNVQVGLGKSKFVAFQAALSGKDALMVSVPIGQETARLAAVPLDEIRWLDQKTTERLERINIRTLGDVLTIKPERWPKNLREISHKLADLAIGKDGDSVKPLWPPPSVERYFGFEDETAMIEPITAAIKLMAGQIAEELTSGQQYCKSLSLRVKQIDGNFAEDCERLVQPTCASGALFRAGVRLLQRLSLSQEVLSLQLRAFDLGTGSGLQLLLLDPDDLSKRFPHVQKRRLEGTISRLRKKFGPAAVFYGDRLPGRGRIGLWTYPLGHILSEPVTVWTDANGVPVSFQRHKKRFPDPYKVTKVHRRWRERSFVWDSQLETAVFRVFSESGGLAELQRMGVRWELRATSD